MTAPEQDSAETETVGRAGKAVGAFRTISEVASELELPQHVLRFWETKFSEIAPMKRAGGRRYYRPEDIAFLRRIKQHLHIDGMTIKGVQKLLRGTAPAAPAPIQPAPPPRPSGLGRDEARRLLADLAVLRDDLRAALKMTQTA